jgi:hypothetical protein
MIYVGDDGEISDAFWIHKKGVRRQKSGDRRKQ